MIVVGLALSFRRGRYLFVLGLIVGWVAMWRPAEVLLYDGFPLYEDRRWIDKLLDADLDIDFATNGAAARAAVEGAHQPGILMPCSAMTF